MTTGKGLPSIWNQGFVPRKSRGQHFLTNQRVLEKITREAGLTENDLVIEVGTGPGNLTENLARSGARIIGFETDARLYQYASLSLRDMTNIQLRHQDFLRVNLEGLVAEYPALSYTVVANLPYAISSPVLFKILECAVPWRIIVIMVQKEFAERLLSPPGTRNCGCLSLATSLVVRTERIMDVSRRSFRPAPKVDSTVLRLVPCPHRLDDRLSERVMGMARIAFGQRRKKLITTLGKELTGRDALREVLEGLGVSVDARPEHLTTDQWIRLAQAYPATQAK